MKKGGVLGNRAENERQRTERGIFCRIGRAVVFAVRRGFVPVNRNRGPTTINCNPYRCPGKGDS